jgi:NAD(P)-dependent dehydrogenase (short-subunit alcohol dehydrogenase family)
MRERKFGRVIVISSINGQKGQAGQTNYSATKAGDVGFVKRAGAGGRAGGRHRNAICPGYIGTEMVRAIDEKCSTSDHPADPGGPAGRARGDRALRGVPGVGRRGLHQRLDDLGQRRAVLRLSRYADLT